MHSHHGGKEENGLCCSNRMHSIVKIVCCCLILYSFHQKNTIYILIFHGFLLSYGTLSLYFLLFLFSECQDLISRCLRIDPFTRLPLEGLLSHPWMTRTFYPNHHPLHHHHSSSSAGAAGAGQPPSSSSTGVRPSCSLNSSGSVSHASIADSEIGEMAAASSADVSADSSGTSFGCVVSSSLPQHPQTHQLIMRQQEHLQRQQLHKQQQHQIIQEEQQLLHQQQQLQQKRARSRPPKSAPQAQEAAMWTTPTEKMPWAQMTAENVSAVSAASMLQQPQGDMSMAAAESWTRQQQLQPPLVGTPNVQGTWPTGLSAETVSWQQRVASAAADSQRTVEAVEADEALMWAPDME